jgi:hypothetical protein
MLVAILSGSANDVVFVVEFAVNKTSMDLVHASEMVKLSLSTPHFV